MLLFACEVAYHFVIQYTIFVLKDPDYYRIDKDQLATELGKIGSYSRITIIIMQPFMGLVFDTFGRKIPIIFGLVLASIITATIPFSGYSLYPWYAIG